MKTNIITKIAYMVEKGGIDPSQVLALTFSKEAERNMREKVEKLLQGKEVRHTIWKSPLRISYTGKAYTFDC